MSPLLLPYAGQVPRLAESAFIAPGAVLTGDLEIGEESSIWFGVVIRADVNVVRIGARSNIQDGTIIHCTSGGHGTYIGDDVTVGHGAVLHACTVEDGAFIGMKACLLDGTVVESGGMVAAGALLTPGKRVKQGELWAGSPAKLLRTLSEEERQNFRESATHYVEVARGYRG